MTTDVRQGLLAVLVLAAPLAQAQEESVEERMLGQVYGQGGKTLYCQAPFDSDEDIKLSRVYPRDRIMDQFDCVSKRQCKTRQSYQDAVTDPHNIYPVKQRVHLDRRGTRFGDLPEDIKVASENCPYQLSFQTFNPPDYARGNVARTMFYMHEVHDLPFVGSLETYKRWNREDPPDDEERARNKAISTMTGRSNPFIENPERADEIESRSPKRLQFGG